MEKVGTGRRTPVTFYCSQMSRYPETVIVIVSAAGRIGLRITHYPAECLSEATEAPQTA